MTTQTTTNLPTQFVPQPSREEIQLREARQAVELAEARFNAEYDEMNFEVLREDLPSLKALWAARDTLMWAEAAYEEYLAVKEWYAHQVD